MYDLSNLNALILAGGLGTRLKHIISDRPKAMAEVNERPFINYILDFLNDYNIKKVTISTGFMADQIENHLGNSYKNIKIDYSEEQSSHGTAGAIKLAKEKIFGNQLLIMNGDSYVEYNLNDFFNFHIFNKSQISILVKELQNRNDFGSIECGQNNKILNFFEKNTSSSGFINAGVYIMDTSIIDEIPEKVPCSIEYDFFPTMLNSQMYCYETKGEFIDIGTPDSFIAAQNFFKNDLNINLEKEA